VLSTANVKSGGNAYASAAAFWPGSAAANLGPLLGTAAGQPIFTQAVPPFPALVTANQDDGNKSVGAEPGPYLAASGKPGAATSKAQPGGGGAPGVFTFAGVSSSSRSVVENGQLVTETVVTVSGISLGAGQVTIDSVKSVARATSTGEKATSEGETVVSGFASGGQGGKLDSGGVSGLNAVGEQILKSSGMRFEVAKPQGKAEGGAADRVSNGVTVYIPNPLAQANPQFAGSYYVLTIAPTAVGALASPPFDADSFGDIPIDTGGDGTTGFSSIAGTFGSVFSPPAESPVTRSSGGGDAPLSLQETKNVLDHDGGVPTGLVLASGGLMVFGGRWVKRYVAQFVSSQDGGA